MIRDIDIKLAVNPVGGKVIAAAENAAMTVGLDVTLKTTLKKYPECVHWHFKHGKESGILEMTWWPSGRGRKAARLWLSMHNNRSADWMVEFIPRIKNLIETNLNSP